MCCERAWHDLVGWHNHRFRNVNLLTPLPANPWFQARDKQMARLTREEKLGALSIQLANGKVLRLSALRGSARCVVVAGTQAQVAKALEAAEPFRAALTQRGVLVVPLPIFGALLNKKPASSWPNLARRCLVFIFRV